MLINILIYRHVRIPTSLLSCLKNCKPKNFYQRLLNIHAQVFKNGFAYFTNQNYFNLENLEFENYDFDRRSIFLGLLKSKDEKYYNLLCPTLHLDSSDILANKFLNCSTFKEILEALNQYSEAVSLDQACQAIFSLSQLKNIQLIKYDNHDIESSLENFCIDNPEFVRVLSMIKENFMNLDYQLVSSLMMCLNNLALEVSHDLMILLHSQILKFISKLNLTSLVRLSFVFCNKACQDYFTQMKMLAEINTKVEYPIELEEFYLLSIFYLNIRKSLSNYTARKYLDTTLKLLEKGKLDNVNPNIIMITLKLLTLTNHKPDLSVDVSRSLMKLLYKDIHTLTAHQHVVLNSIFNYFLEPKFFLYKIQEHASRLINEDTNINFKPDLLLCLSTNSNFKMRINYGLQTKQNITESFNPKDTHALYKILRILNIPNFQLFEEFWMKNTLIIKHTINNCKQGEKEEHISHIYKKYLYFNDNFAGHFRSKKFEEEVIAILEDELKSPLQFMPSKIASIVGFLIAYSKKAPPSEHLYEYLKRNCIQFKPNEWMLVNKCLKTFHNFHSLPEIKHIQFITKVAKLFIDSLRNLLSVCIFCFLFLSLQKDELV